jgi:hypothetical protein
MINPSKILYTLPVQLNCLEELKTIGYNAWDKRFNPWYQLVDEIYLNSVSAVLIPELKLRWNIECEVDRALLFRATQGWKMRIHVDGYMKKSVQLTSLNIPILNGGSGITRWYDGNYTLAPAGGTDMSKEMITWNTPPTLVHEHRLDSATFLRVNQPHDMVMAEPVNRVIMAIRTTPGWPPLEELKEKIFDGL